MWPNESTTPSRARMRLAVTSSSIRSSSLAIGLLTYWSQPYMSVQNGSNCAASSLDASHPAFPIELFSKPAKADCLLCTQSSHGRKSHSRLYRRRPPARQRQELRGGGRTRGRLQYRRHLLRHRAAMQPRPPTSRLPHYLNSHH